MKLITGANGRVGNYLVRELNRRGERVKVFMRKSSKIRSLEGADCEFVFGDVLDIESLEKAMEGVDIVFHLAGYINISNTEREKTFQINIQGTQNVVDVCLAKNIKLVYASSIHAFDAPKNGSVITENTALSLDERKSRGIYDYSKAAATNYVLEKMQNGLQGIVIYPTGILGPYDYTPSFFGKGMIELVKSGVKNTIGGRYDYVDVRDVVDGMLKSVELEKWGESYILSGEVMSMKSYASYLQELLGIKNTTHILSYPLTVIIGFFESLYNSKSEITVYSVDTLNSNCNISHQKASFELDYHPRPARDSVIDQYNWFKENGYL